MLGFYPNAVCCYIRMYVHVRADMNFLNIAMLRSCGNLQSFLTDSKIHTLSYALAKTNENGTFKSLNKSIGM